MVNKYQYRNLIWVDLESPTQNEVRAVMEEFRLEPIVAEELIVPSLKPKADLHSNCIFLVLHFPTLKARSEQQNQEIDFIIGRDFLITCRYETIDPLHQFSKVFEVNSILDKSNMGEHAGFIFYYMIRTIYHHLIDQLDVIKTSLSQVEEQIFEGHERQMVLEVSKLNRDLLDFKEATRAHQSVLDSFENAGEKFFGLDFKYYLRSITSEYYKLHSEIEGNKDFLEELRRTNDSLLSAKQNETMRVLTVVSIIFFALTFMAAFFSISAINSQLVNFEHDVILIGSSMTVVALGILALFKYKNWL